MDVLTIASISLFVNEESGLKLVGTNIPVNTSLISLFVNEESGLKLRDWKPLEAFN